jgi:hypothetical protein
VSAVDVDLDDLGLDEGGHLLIARGLAGGGAVRVRGAAPTLAVDLPAWCRARACAIARAGDAWLVEPSAADRWRSAEQAAPSPQSITAGAGAGGARRAGRDRRAGARLPLADRTRCGPTGGAAVRPGAAQWDPATAIPWDAPIDHPAEVEDAVVQVMTYLIENETAALLVPTRFLGKLHPHFREVMQLLAIQIADEARHVEVFTRRATLRRAALGLSTAGGQASLATLFAEPDFAIASFLLSVLGEGSFLALLWFLRDHAPDACTRAVATLAAQDEARHVAFGLAHLGRHAARDPSLRERLAAAIERRHAALAHTSGLNAELSTRWKAGGRRLEPGGCAAATPR